MAHRTKQRMLLKGCAREGRLMDQKPENIMRPFSPCIIPMPIAPKKVLMCACVRAYVCVCVTSPLLKVPAYLAELAACRNFYVLMREIYSMGVVSSSVQLFRKGEINSDSENCSALTRVLLLVSEAQGMWPCSLHIIPMPSPPKDFFVRLMSRVLKPQIICLQSPQVTLP